MPPSSSSSSSRGRGARRVYFEITVFTTLKHAEAKPIVIFYNSPPHVAIWGWLEGVLFRGWEVEVEAHERRYGFRLHTFCRDGR